MLADVPSTGKVLRWRSQGLAGGRTLARILQLYAALLPHYKLHRTWQTSWRLKLLERGRLLEDTGEALLAKAAVSSCRARTTSLLDVLCLRSVVMFWRNWKLLTIPASFPTFALLQRVRPSFQAPLQEDATVYACPISSTPRNMQDDLLPWLSRGSAAHKPYLKERS